MTLLIVGAIHFLPVVSFLVLSFAVGGINPQLSRVVFADIVAVIILVAGASAYVWSHSRAGYPFIPMECHGRLANSSIELTPQGRRP